MLAIARSAFSRVVGRQLMASPSLLPSRRGFSSQADTTDLGDDYLYRIVLTGGPNGGKSTTMAHLAEMLRTRGLAVLCVPETAAVLHTGGVEYTALHTDDQLVNYQLNLIRMQMQAEETFINIARSFRKPSVVLMDRGCMDPKAYVPSRVWARVLAEGKWADTDLRDGRYDAVLHLVSTAINSEEFYKTLAQQNSRHKSIEEAVKRDHALRGAWLGHSNLHVIGNPANSANPFEVKVKQATEAVCSMVGLPSPHSQVDRKFLLKSAGNDELIKTAVGDKLERFDVSVHFLNRSSGLGRQIRLIRRSQGTIDTFSYTSLVKSGKDEQEVVQKRQLSRRGYDNYLNQANKSYHPVSKSVLAFLWEDQFFELERWNEPHKGLTMLRTLSETAAEKINFPPFVKVVKEVTTDHQYSHESLALDIYGDVIPQP